MYPSRSGIRMRQADASFLLQCFLVFDLKPLNYHSDGLKITFVNLLSERAAQRATVVMENWTPASSSFPAFTAELRRVFDHPVQSGEAASLCSTSCLSPTLATFRKLPSS